ncbi:hypothetical protein BN1195_02476 [Chryseobacterium oranimense G311]|nr:hypothetical protein BN1195_02476 [Chryseobacterium oranimense G311]
MFYRADKADFYNVANMFIRNGLLIDVPFLFYNDLKFFISQTAEIT